MPKTEAGPTAAHTRVWSRLAIPTVLLVLICAFLHRNVLEGRAAIPFDLLNAFDPWKSQLSGPPPVPSNPELFDQVAQFYPWRKLVVDEIRQGRFPLWNPYSFAGSPLFANGQSGVLYPLNVLSLFFDASLASIVLACARLMSAGIVTWLFLRKLRLRREAAFFGVVAFTFSLNVIVWLGFPAANAAILIPALFWACERLIERDSAGNLVLGAVLVAVQFFAGQPQTSLVSAFGVSIYLALRLASAGKPLKQTLRILTLFAGCWVMGAALAAVQLLPMVEYMKESAAWAFRGGFNLKAYPWYELISFIVPDFFGTPYEGNYWGFANLVGTACYIGVAPLVLALMSLTTVAHRAPVRCFWVIALLCLGLVYKVPLLGRITSLPLFSAIDTNKFLVMIVFSLGVCAAVELNGILEGNLRGSTLRAVLAVAASTGIAAAARFQLRDVWRALNLSSYESRNFGVFLALAIVTALTLYGRERGWLNGVALACTLTVMLYGDLFFFGHSYNAAADRDLFAQARIFPLDDHKSYRILGIAGAMPPNTSSVFGLSDVRGYDALTPRRYFTFLSMVQPGYRDFLQTLELNNFMEDTFTRSTLLKREIRRMLSGPGETDLQALLKRAFYWNTNLDGLATSKVLDAFSVRFLIGGNTTPVSENTNALPRTYLRRDFIVTDESSALELATKPDFDFHRSLLISGVGNRDALPTTSPEPPTADDRAEISWAEPSLVEISAHSGGPRVLVLTDLFFPGWEAEVDGKPAPIFAANYLFRAVAVPQAGPHTIRFTYKPSSFAWGLTLTTVAALACLGLLGFAALRRRA